MQQELDRWKFFDITHKNHVVCNPMSTVKIDEMIELLKLDPGSWVLDIACGKGETLTRIAERYSICGVGVDLSPFFVEDARQKLIRQVPQARIEILNIDGAEYQADRLFHLSMCIGASWIYQGHRGTLRALKSMTRPTGLILVGEPFWIKEPEEAYLDATGETRDDFGTHYGNVIAGQEEGLAPLYTIASNLDDWDRYETLQWYSAEKFAEENKNDPDVPEILARVNRNLTNYLRWGRETIGWALYLFKNSAANH